MRRSIASWRVYRGGPEDYADVVEIPDRLLIGPGAGGRHHVEYAWRITASGTRRLPGGSVT